jgi:Uma2 family endonuclease
MRVRYVTAHDFVKHPAAAGPAELVRGEVRPMTPAGGAHGVIAGRIFAAVNAFVEAKNLGLCFPDNTGFALPGLVDTVRSPDMAFVRASALPSGGIGRGWILAAPDLVVEVVSPTEAPDDLAEKLRDYRTAGTQLIWVVDPDQRKVRVLAAGRPDVSLTDTDELTGGEVLPGFVLAVARLFAHLAA